MAFPPEYRFHPTAEELVTYFLNKRVKGIPLEFDVIADVDLYKCEPWDLPEKSRLSSTDSSEWYFFSAPDRKYPNGERTNRTTEAGYWEPTGPDRFVKTGPRIVGLKKTLVFYLGRGHAHGERTDWLMDEYRLDGDEWEATNVSKDAWTLCRVFKENDENGLHELVDSADVSPSETRLPDETRPNQTRPLAVQSLEAVPLAVPPSVVRSALPVVLPPAIDFDYAGSLPQLDIEAFDVMFSGFPELEGMPDFPPLLTSTPDPSEFSREGQQIHADNMASEFSPNCPYEMPDFPFDDLKFIIL